MNLEEIKDALREVVTSIESLQDALDEYEECEDDECTECTGVDETDETDDEDDETDDDDVFVDLGTPARDEFIDSIEKDSLVDGVEIPDFIDEDTLTDRQVVLVVDKDFLEQIRELIVE
jgi:hypothetical protein